MAIAGLTMPACLDWMRNDRRRQTSSAHVVTTLLICLAAHDADLAIGQIAPHFFRVAARRIAVAAAAGGLEHDPIPGAQRGHELGGHRLLAAPGTMDDGAGHGPVVSARRGPSAR